MKTAAQKMNEKIAAQSTETLIEIVRAMNLDTTSEGILVSSKVTGELEARLPEDAFLALMLELEAELDAA